MVAAHRALVTLGATALRTYTDSTHIPNQPMIVILNLAIGGWLGYPNKHTVFPAHMLVDYVRVWNGYPY